MEWVVNSADLYYAQPHKVLVMKVLFFLVKKLRLNLA